MISEATGSHNATLYGRVNVMQPKNIASIRIRSVASRDDLVAWWESKANNKNKNSKDKTRLQ